MVKYGLSTETISFSPHRHCPEKTRRTALGSESSGRQKSGKGISDGLEAGGLRRLLSEGGDAAVLGDEVAGAVMERFLMCRGAVKEGSSSLKPRPRGPPPETTSSVNASTGGVVMLLRFAEACWAVRGARGVERVALALDDRAPRGGDKAGPACCL
jgi:hypothetical protein